jgi:hypothetical protein
MRHFEKTLDWVDAAPTRNLTLEEPERFHVMYQRAAADLAKVSTLASEGDLPMCLERWVSRDYADIGGIRLYDELKQRQLL